MRKARIRMSAAVALAALAVAAPAHAAERAASKPAIGTPLSSRLAALATPELRDASPSAQAEALSLPAHGQASLSRVDGAVVVEAQVNGPTAERVSGLEEAGAEIVHVSTRYRTITAAVEEGSLRAVARAPGVDSVTEVLEPAVGRLRATPGDGTRISTCAGSVTSEGDVQLRAATARPTFNVDGTGVEVGVLSDSFNRDAAASTHAATDIATADLPGPGNPCGRTTPVTALDDTQPGEDEGRAMLQVVHDLAPGADLAFATALPSETAMADNIHALANAGADVIVDDVAYRAEPAFQDGIIADAVNDVTAQGVAYFSAAGNNNIISGGRNVASWEAPAFRLAASCPAGLPAYATQCMDFNPGAGTDPTYGFTIGAGRTVRMALHWAQPQQGVTTDLDLYVLSGASLEADSEDANVNITHKPVELLGLTNSGASAATVQVAINRYTGPGGGNSATPRLKLIHINNGGQASFPTEFTVSSGGDVVGPAIFGHAGAQNAMAAAAVPFNNSATVENFSSRGPVTHYFGPANGVSAAPALPSPQVLSKPDIAATDGGRTTFFGTANRFFGTSAAAPHAAAVAALQLDANGTLTADQVKAAQKATARPVGLFGATARGSGLIDAAAAVAALPPPPPTVSVASLGPTADRTPTFTFSTTGDLKALTCSLDGRPPAPCSSPFQSPPLPDGTHNLVVVGADYFGQNGAGAGKVRVDTKGPRAKIKRHPAKRSDKRKAKFTFKAERGARFECKVDRKRFERCKSPLRLRVKPGRHKFRVRARDALGNVGRPASFRWTVRP